MEYDIHGIQRPIASDFYRPNPDLLDHRGIDTKAVLDARLRSLVFGNGKFEREDEPKHRDSLRAVTEYLGNRLVCGTVEAQVILNKFELSTAFDDIDLEINGHNRSALYVVKFDGDRLAGERSIDINNEKPKNKFIDLSDHQYLLGTIIVAALDLCAYADDLATPKTA